MTVGELTKYLEDWAPPGAAWEKDNVGLQVGSSRATISNIMLCLELDDEVLKEALKKKCNFIFTHHPLIFKPIRKLDTGKDQQARLIEKILKNGVTVYSAHTNLDFTKDGISFELAKTLKLKNIRFLELEEGNQYKIVSFVPAGGLTIVANAVFESGAGIIGEYENCGFTLSGEGSFKGSAKSKPSVGKKNTFEKVEEIRFEFIVDSWKLNKVVSALVKSHPYEEPAFDIYPLKNKNVNFGAGTIGELEKGMNEKEFLSHISRLLKTKCIKYCSGKSVQIKNVAVCGGSGSELIQSALNSGADAFVTADLKYHAYQDAKGKILLADAGHYETEIMGLSPVEKKIKMFIADKAKIKILKYTGSTNPVKFYKQ
ncbi:MAG: Nif3-like dinuclear metal center hexameric protein [Ignavibacteriae bacterium HGW-Ignavibacteriae-3]|nr:MAG: Nif3-like dinuclear metal center hexameric protein [Ignavibacteriae bacterium HGW-Ignavibacteriae-3]